MVRPNAQIRNLGGPAGSIQKTMKENVKISVDGSVRELIIREGQAPPVVLPDTLSITGNIDAPALFYEHRKELPEDAEQYIDPTTALVIINEEEKSILLMVNPKNSAGMDNNIKGALKFSPELHHLGVFWGNVGQVAKIFKRQDFRKFLTFNRRFFVQDEHFANLLAGIGKLEMAIQQVANETSNNRGEFDSHASRAIQTNLPKVVTLEHEAYKGCGKIRYLVEVCYDIEDRVPVFWLESPELAQQLEEIAHAQIKSVIKRLDPLCVITQ